MSGSPAPEAEADPDITFPPGRAAEPGKTAPPKKTAAPVSKKRGALHYLGVALSALLLLAVIGLGAALIVIPKLGGAIPLTVLTQSMKPGLPPGTLLIIKPIDPAAVKVGDIVTYQIRSGDPAVITHRVIGVSTTAEGERRFVFQGDNNADPDPDPVRDAQIQGKLWYSIPYAGFVNSAVNGEQRPWIVGVVAGAFFLYALYMLVSWAVGRGRRRRARGSEVDSDAESEAETAADRAEA